MLTADEILDKLNAHADPAQLPGMARYGMSTENRLGVKIPVLRALAKQVGRQHALALDLWASGIAEARILAAMIADPAQLTGEQMDAWVADFDSWDVCDQVCMNLFDKSPLALEKVHAWAGREEEFVRRAAFALIACIAWHDRNAEDQLFIDLLPVITQGATDERNYVKKAVSWALRHIGKRNRALNRAAVAAAKQLQACSSRAARWVASDALRELTGKAVQSRLC